MPCVHGQAGAAVAKYDVHAVVANILDTRKEVVQLVRRSAAAEGVSADTVLRGSSTVIEQPLVDRIVQLHRAHCPVQQ